MKAIEVDGRSEMAYMEIETSIDSLNGSVIFHIVTEILGFVLYMHQQIPSNLQDISVEFDTLQTEHLELETVLAQTEVKASSRRRHAGRMREVKREIRRLQKLMNTMSSLRNALQLVISEIPDIKDIILILGASPLRPQHVYELCFSHGKVVHSGACDFTKSKAAEGLSRKVNSFYFPLQLCFVGAYSSYFEQAIRAMISKGAGSDSYSGPTKLFLLVKASSSLNMPLHFLPKRDFRYNKKVVPFRLQLKCRAQDHAMVAPQYVSQGASSINFMDSAANDLIWFQCRHIIKGLASKTSSIEE